MIKQIEIRNLLPCVFAGMEDTDRIRSSQIWEEPSFVFHRGCRLCVHAESGNGKSSLLHFIYGSRKDYKGSILFDGTDISILSIAQWCEVRTKGIALLPQDMALFPTEVSTIWWENSAARDLYQALRRACRGECPGSREGCLIGRDACRQWERWRFCPINFSSPAGYDLKIEPDFWKRENEKPLPERREEW